MASSTRQPLTQDGHSPEHGATLDHLLPEVYDELREVARRQLSRRSPGGTLTATGLVHEAYLKLRAQPGATWHDEAHFVSLAATVMRHVLVDRARARSADKRQGDRQQITLDDNLIPADEQPEALLQLHDAIDRLALEAPRLAQVVDCRFFGGLTDGEIAAALHVTPRTVQRDWLKARLLLRRALAP